MATLRQLGEKEACHYRLVHAVVYRGCRKTLPGRPSIVSPFAPWSPQHDPDGHKWTAPAVPGAPRIAVLWYGAPFSSLTWNTPPVTLKLNIPDHSKVAARFPTSTHPDSRAPFLPRRVGCGASRDPWTCCTSSQQTHGGILEMEAGLLVSVSTSSKSWRIHSIPRLHLLFSVAGMLAMDGSDSATPGPQGRNPQRAMKTATSRMRRCGDAGEPSSFQPCRRPLHRKGGSIDYVIAGSLLHGTPA